MIEDRVVWTEKEEEEDRYRIAIHFPSSRRAIYVYLNIYICGGMVTRDQLPRPNSSGIRIEARVAAAAAAFSRAVCQTGGEDIRGHIFLPGKRTRSRGKTLANNEDKGGGEEGEEGGKGGKEEERKKTESEKKRLKVL